MRRVRWLLVPVLLASACSTGETEPGPATTSLPIPTDATTVPAPPATVSSTDAPDTATTQAPVDPNLGMSVADYLALPPAERHLYDLGAMPVEVIESFDLVALFVRVLFPSELADTYEAIGLETPVGIVGPYPIDVSGSQRVIGSAPWEGTISLVGWPHGSASGDTSQPEAICPAVPPIVISELEPTPLATDVIEVECGSGTVTVVDGSTGAVRQP